MKNKYIFKIHYVINNIIFAFHILNNMRGQLLGMEE
jgi:hypothetical protein